MKIGHWNLRPLMGDQIRQTMLIIDWFLKIHTRRLHTKFDSNGTTVLFPYYDRQPLISRFQSFLCLQDADNGLSEVDPNHIICTISWVHDTAGVHSIPIKDACNCAVHFVAYVFLLLYPWFLQWIHVNPLSPYWWFRARLQYLHC